MNKVFYRIVFLFFWVAFWGCKKENSFNGSSINVFTENLATLKKGEPILLSFNIGGAIPPIWTVSPNTNVSINAVANNASIEFKTAGKYTIVASAAGKQGTYIATVMDSSFNVSGSGFSLIANKIVDVSPLQIVEFSVQNAASSSLLWSVSSNVNNVAIANNKLSAQVSFNAGIGGAVNNVGSVTVTDGINNQTRTVWLNTNQTSTHTMVPFLYTDKLLVTPSVITDTQGIKTLVLRAKTQLSYQCSNETILSSATENNGYAISYGGVNMSKTICTTKEPPTAINSFSNMPLGTHTFTIHFGNKTLVGAVTYASNGVFSFSWNNNTDVVISPLSVQ